jgi:hypothetical protein
MLAFVIVLLAEGRDRLQHHPKGDRISFEPQLSRLLLERRATLAQFS